MCMRIRICCAYINVCCRGGQWSVRQQLPSLSAREKGVLGQRQKREVSHSHEVRGKGRIAREKGVRDLEASEEQVQRLASLHICRISCFASVTATLRVEFKSCA